ncbi:hypothetical protein GGR56DRAFT_660588 [Xylariaceae sp. FL0804]|nr:hypothetical protein GGR56DRAFT_660588 [Xylariaceae sp. FL0804]
MEVVSPESPPRPCEYFDLIGGTSTGGLIAIMLGRLHMGVDECIQKYLEVSSAAFQLKRSKVNIIGRAKDLLKGEGAYRGDQLAAEFKKAALAFDGDENAKLLLPDSPCKAFVCSFEQAYNSPTRFRTYIANTTKSASTHDCTIWEAARATSAAATFFDQVVIGQQSYVDGATGSNNPVEIVLEEARDIWPDALARIQSIVSIGTGVPEPKAFGNDFIGILSTLKNIATETQKTHLRFQKSHKDLGLEGRYFRFNVDKGLAGVRLDEHAKVSIIDAATRMYLDSPEVHSDAVAFAAVTPPNSDFVVVKDHHQLLEWLPHSDQQKFYNEASSLRRTETTGGWFINGAFEAWMQGSGSLLWLHAPAGGGKTVITSTIIDSIGAYNCDLLAYYYFSFQRKEQQNMRDLKSALLVQLVKRLSRDNDRNPDTLHVPRAFVRLRDICHPSRSPTLEALDKTLVDIINKSPKTVIVIDALDECDSTQLQADVLKFAKELLERTTTALYVLVTSRPEVDIADIVDQMPIAKRSVPFDTRCVDKDIDLHLRHLIKEQPYARWSPSLKEKVIDHIRDRSGGVFRYADLQIQFLRGKVREVDVERALKSLPKNLGDTYRRILDRIKLDNYGQEALAVLRWLAYAQRPLRLSEVAELAAFDYAQSPGSGLANSEVTFKPRNRFESPSELHRILSGLINLSNPFTYEDPHMAHPLDVIVSFSHFSVREYLESEEAPEEFRLRREDCHWFIFKCCVAYIEDYDSTTEATSETVCQPTHPLILYTCSDLWWHIHYMYSVRGVRESDELSESIAEALGPFLDKRGYAFDIALQLGDLNSSSRVKYARDFIQSQSLPSHFLSDEVEWTLSGVIEFGDVRLLELFLRAGITVPADALTWVWPQPIDYSQIIVPQWRRDCNSSVSSQLLKFAIEKNPTLHDHLAPNPNVHCAISDESAGRRSILWELLLKCPGVDINATNYSRQTPLLLSALQGNEAFFKFLIAQEGVRLGHCDSHGWGLATCAFQGGHMGIIDYAVQCLNKSDFQVVDRYGWTPVEWAKYKGYRDLIPSSKLPEPIQDAVIPSNPKSSISFREVRAHSYGEAGVLQVSFSNDGTRLAILVHHGCIITNVASGKTIVSLRGYDGSDDPRCSNVAWSPDDSLIAACCLDYRVKIFRTESGDLLKVIEFDYKPVDCNWFPNGESFIISSGDWEHPPAHFNGSALSPDGRYVVAFADGKNARAIYVFETESKMLRYSVDIPDRGTNVTVSPDSRWILLSLSTGGYQILDITNGAVVQDVAGATPRRLDYSIKAFGGLHGSWVVRSEFDGLAKTHLARTTSIELWSTTPRME